MWPILFVLNLVEIITMPAKITCNSKTNMASYNIAMIPLPMILTLQWRHKELGGVWNHQPHDCLLTYSFRRRSSKTSKLRVTGICEGISPVSIWWCHDGYHSLVLRHRYTTWSHGLATGNRNKLMLVITTYRVLSLMSRNEPHTIRK